MLKHFLKLIYRNFTRSKGYFFINLGGLAAGLTCTLLIYLWVRDEFNMDKFHEKKDRLYQVMAHVRYSDRIDTNPRAPGLLAESFKAEFPEVEHTVTTSWMSGYTLSWEEKNVKAQAVFAGPEYFDVFSYRLLQGSPAQVLKDKMSVVISRSLAVKLFGTDEDVLGKVIEFQRRQQLHVTGVFEDVPSSSSQRFECVMAIDLFADFHPWIREWGNSGVNAYVVLKEGSSVEGMNAKIKDYMKGKSRVNQPEFFLQKYADRYLYATYENGVQRGGRIDYVRMFSVIAVFILLIACINFMNLSTARATKKAKEVGIRKTVGAGRELLIYQYIIEALATAFLALFVAVIVVWLFLPTFNEITGKQILFSMNDFQLLMSFTIITLIAGFCAGSYPALYLSGFRPATVLKGVVKGSAHEFFARRGLVIFQFFLSVILIVSVIVIYRQIEYVQQANLGYDKEQLVRIQQEGRTWPNVAPFLEKIKQTPGVKSAGLIAGNLLRRGNGLAGLEWEGKAPDYRVYFEDVVCDPGLLETLGADLAEGRFLSEAFATDSNKVVFNESAIKAMNLVDPIGKKVSIGGADHEIIGVVKDFHFLSLHEAVTPLFFRIGPRDNSWYTWSIMVRLTPGQERQTMQAIDAAYKDFVPGFPMEYVFQDEEYARHYVAEQRVSTLSLYFAGLAVCISCLGLFGLAAFTAERRLKEIGIRKVMGSSVTNAVLLLTGDFTKMVLTAIVFSIPVGYVLLDMWLERFAYHIELSFWYFAAAGAVAILVAWITVSWQAVKAARVNPVKCLRAE